MDLDRRLSANLFKKNFRLMISFCSQCLFLVVFPFSIEQTEGNLNYLVGMCIQFKVKRKCRIFTNTVLFLEKNSFNFTKVVFFLEEPKIMSFCLLVLSDLAAHTLDLLLTYTKAAVKEN
jgi:hypothetical protein